MVRTGSKTVPERKKTEVKKLVNALERCKTMGIVDMTNLPSKQLQTIRGKLRGKAEILMSKKRLIKLAFQASKNKDVAKLADNLKGIPALILTDLEPFELFRILKKNQSPASAKSGQIAPRDIEVKAGPTSLTPGPAISTFGNAGVPAGVEAGKIAVKKDTVVITEGEVFSQNVVDVLNLLNMEPMTIGIKLIVALSNGELFESKLLDINVEEFIEKIASAHVDAFKLATELNIVNSDTASFLITHAELNARALATETGMLTDETKAGVLAKAEAGAKAVKEVIEK